MMHMTLLSMSFQSILWSFYLKGRLPCKRLPTHPATLYKIFNTLIPCNITDMEIPAASRYEKDRVAMRDWPEYHQLVKETREIT